MRLPPFERVTTLLTSTEFFLGLLWVGLAALSITLLVLMRTRWGQSQPLRKCLVLSLLAHLLLAGYATTVQIWSSGPKPLGDPTIYVAISDDDHETTDTPTSRSQKPWNQFADETIAPPLSEPTPTETPPPPEPERVVVANDDAILEETDPASTPTPEVDENDPAAMETAPTYPKLARQPEDIEAPEPERRESAPIDTPSSAVDRPLIQPEAPLPERPETTGLPSVLREVPPSVPQTTDEADSANGELVRDMTDSPESTPNGQPAEATAANGPSKEQSTAANTSTPEMANADASTNTDQGASEQVAMRRQQQPAHKVPEIYRERLSPNRSENAERHGATHASEAAVADGLKWLAANQEPDGRWSASRHGAGREMRVGGEDRGGTGGRADSGITGLALLAFLAAGNTHQRGDYHNTVARGLEFLISVQKPDGDMSAGATMFAKMYCHSMATFALCEAYGMTGDARLERPVRRAIGYTVASQDRRTGGWRYTPGMAGDTSQLGWQLMALKSAELAGVPISPETRRGAIQFLRSVSYGQHGGLASYRPGEKTSRPMTAEAMVCRQLLGMPPNSPTAIEAADHILAELPGKGSVNLYYWYYSTLGLYQLQDDHWPRWNQALQNELVRRQRDSGNDAGSWDPETVWGGYGGRVYSTALATLCLEVYYRYLPRYLETATADQTRR